MSREAWAGTSSHPQWKNVSGALGQKEKAWDVKLENWGHLGGITGCKANRTTQQCLLCSPREIQRKRVGCIVKLEQVSKRSVLLRRKILLSPQFYLIFNFLFIVFLLVLKEQKCNYMHISALKVLENFPYRSREWQEVLWFVKAVLTTCTPEPKHWCIEGLWFILGILLNFSFYFSVVFRLFFNINTPLFLIQQILLTPLIYVHFEQKLIFNSPFLLTRPVSWCTYKASTSRKINSDNYG